jgi:predicted metalloprotease with PDZ domain
MPTQPLLSYEVGVADAAAHMLDVELTLSAGGSGAGGAGGATARDDGKLPESVVLFMPVWAPGSYLVREYARHLEGLTAETPAGRVSARKVRKNAWAISTGGARSLTVRYRLYANDLSVRTNHVDASHAFWNGPSTYLVPEHMVGDGFSCVVHASVPETWSVATGLSPLASGDPSAAPGADAAPRRPGVERAFSCSSLDELMDCPFECGPMEERTFLVHGRQHEMWVWSSRHAGTVDWKKLSADTATIIDVEARLLAGDRPVSDALPYDRYAFLWHVSPRGRGGLEHANSCAMLVSPVLFTTRGGYLDVLSLVAHEFFHLWNVKRIRPAGLSPCQYEAENYTRLLWWFEGGTSYFDWRVLRLAGLCSVREYADHLAGELARLADTPGALVHPLEEASFDAWIKAYRPDENSVNTTVSYYLKGEVVCAMLDVEIRARTGGKRSLDDVLRHLWWAYGARDRPVPEEALPEIIAGVAGVPLGDVLGPWVQSNDRVDTASVLAKAGLWHERKPQPRQARASLGVKLRSRHGKPVIDSVFRGSSAMRGGLDNGDELLAIGGRRVEDGGIDNALHGLSAGAEVDVVFTRDGMVESRKVTLDPPMCGDGRLLLREDASPAQIALLEAWLGQGAAAALRGHG